MKNGLKLSCMVLLVLGSMQGHTLRAMNDDKNMQQLQIMDLPDDVLLHVLSFVVAQDPNAVGNLFQIQTISKRFKGMLTDQQITWISGLTQEKLNTLLTDAVNSLNAKKVELWIRFGAKLLPAEVAKLLRTQFDLVVNEVRENAYRRVPRALPQKYTQENMLKITKMLLVLGGDQVNDFEFMQHVLVNACELGWYETIKYLLENKLSVDVEVWRAVVESDRSDMVQLLLDNGANPNLGESRFTTKPPLYYVKSAKVARILLDGGAQLYVNCQPDAQKPGSQSPTFDDMVQRAARLNSPSIIIAILTKNYSLETATAIALALMAGASLAGMMCTIL